LAQVAHLQRQDQIQSLALLPLRVAVMAVITTVGTVVVEVLAAAAQEDFQVSLVRVVLETLHQ
jgi:hypothetical protein